MVIAYKRFTPPLSPKVAPLAAALSAGATKEDWYILSPITPTLHVLRSLTHEVIIMNTLEATSGAIMTHS